MTKYEEKIIKTECRLPAQNTSTTKRGWGNVLPAITRSISEIFASARIPCTWLYNIHNQEDIIFNGVKHQKLPLLTQVKAIPEFPQMPDS